LGTVIVFLLVPWAIETRCWSGAGWIRRMPCGQTPAVVWSPVFRAGRWRSTNGETNLWPPLPNWSCNAPADSNWVTRPGNRAGIHRSECDGTPAPVGCGRHCPIAVDATETQLCAAMEAAL